jgi:hypothetical protein
VATAQPVVQPGGSTVFPATMLAGLAVYTERLTSRLPGSRKLADGARAAALAPGAARRR